MLTDDPRALDCLRSIDHSLARIAASLEALVKIADELATTREAQNSPLTLERRS